MKILQINAVYGHGSTGRTCAELDDELRKRGVDSYVAATKTTVKRDNVYIIGNKWDWKIHAFLSRLTGLQGYFSYFPTLRLLNYIRRIKPDVIHLRNLHANYINLPKLLEFVAREDIPIVVTLHDCWFFTGRCCYYTDVKCDKWQKKCGHCPSLKKWNKSWFFDRSSKMLRDKRKLFSSVRKVAVVGVSEWTTNEAKKSILSDSLVIKRIYNWIDLDIFQPYDCKEEIRRRHNLPDKPIALGVSYRWTSDKGIDILLSLAQETPELNYILIGELPGSLLVPKNVTTVGRINDSVELAKYYSAAEVFINPSTQETFGKTTVEATACGTPVVAYGVTATSELVNVDCGILIGADGGIDAFANAIREITRRPKSSYQDNCVSFVKDNFDKKQLINDYIKLYQELTQCE